MYHLTIWIGRNLTKNFSSLISSIWLNSILYKAKIKNVNSYYFDHTLTNNIKIKKDFNQNLLPLTFNTNFFGIKCLEEDKSYIIDNLKFKNKNKNFLNFVSRKRL